MSEWAVYHTHITVQTSFKKVGNHHQCKPLRPFELMNRPLEGSLRGRYRLAPLCCQPFVAKSRPLARSVSRRSVPYYSYHSLVKYPGVANPHGAHEKDKPTRGNSISPCPIRVTFLWFWYAMVFHSIRVHIYAIGCARRVIFSPNF
jgi:hypothetical protein